MNVIIADSLDFIATEVEKITGGNASKTEAAIVTVLSGIAKEHLAVVYDGNGYIDEWQTEAAKRGLPNLKNTVDALPALVDPKNVAVLAKYGVLSERELHSRYDISLEKYIKDVNTESMLALEIAKTKILPAALTYQKDLASLAVDLKTIGKTPDTSSLDEVITLTSELSASIKEFEKILAHEGDDDLVKHATYMRDSVLPIMLKTRESVDALEGVVADELWPLPTYQEMLFIK
jgi:glutamine synthetase